ncbi:MAG: hypothetical protein IKI37_11500 [Oscillospiraceae bacterium]|nr:hypothetical protein [Oscillospiraceae bacterium]MBR7085777.1 hypothetical protein [Oscillospiraceae bacterium]
MIKLKMNAGVMEMELNGSDELLIDEFSTAIIRMLYAFERHSGVPVKENLTKLILTLISRQNQYSTPPC